MVSSETNTFSRSSGGAGASGAVASLRRSPAAALAELFQAAAVEGERGVTLREIPFLIQLGIRATPGSSGASALENALGSPLPTRYAQTLTGGGYTLLWLGPDEFLAVGNDACARSCDAPAEAARVAEALGEPGGRLPGAVVDLSANRTTLELSGASARAVLEKGVSYDLHPEHFLVGQAIMTSVEHVPVILWRKAEETYRIMPRASFAEHVGRWLVDAMREFSVEEGWQR